MLQYRKKLRPLRVRTLDSSIKTLLVDDSQTVAELTRTVCARIGGCKGVWSQGVGVAVRFRKYPPKMRTLYNPH